MSRPIEWLLALLFLFGAESALASDPPSVGRAATPAEIQAWDIDVRPDFSGLPKGSGSVRQGQKIWDGKCASCHGTFGELSDFSSPITEGTTLADIKLGRVKSLLDPNRDLRSTMMKVPTVSTLWDYIYRAMPWTAPKSLSVDETYAAVAYILNLSDMVADDFVLDQHTIRDVQAFMPNRNGMTSKHGLSNVNNAPDVSNMECMVNCANDVSIHALISEAAQRSHGNLEAQNRRFGPVRGAKKRTGD